jgi:hypothetical protein
MKNKEDKTPLTGTEPVDADDRTPAFGTEIIREHILDDSQTTDLDKRPRINWKEGYRRLAIILSVLWGLFFLITFINNGGLSWGGWDDFFIILGGFVFIWAVPFVVSWSIKLYKWLIEGFTEKPEDE